MNNIKGISNLEADILLIVWNKGNVTNRQVHEEFLKKEVKNKDANFIPYTTVMSTMNSLVRKKILKIDKSKKTYFYSAAMNREELASAIIKSVEEKLL